MAVLIENTVVNDPDTGLPTVLEVGEQVPVWAVDQVGDHLVEEDEVEASYVDEKVTDLRMEIDRRNADRDPSGDGYIKPAGAAKDDLVAALEADDELQRGSE